MLGYERDVSEFALESTSYMSVERAVGYVNDLQFNGKYEHPFMPLANLGICKLCNNTKDLHADEESAKIIREQEGPRIIEVEK